MGVSRTSDRAGVPAAHPRTARPARLTRRAAVRCAIGALMLVAALAAHDLWAVHRIARTNEQIEQIAAGAAPPAEAGNAPRELRFAQAYAQAASGAGEAALNRYGALHADDAIGRAARYNSANLLLRQAIDMRAQAEPGQALALIELAKENYRQILRSAPDDWDARYNLERAQRLVPEPEAEDDEPLDLKRNAERAATTMRAYSPGLP